MREYLIGSYAPNGCNSIFRIRRNESNQKMECVAAYDCAENPSFLLKHPQKEIVYAVEEMVPNGKIAVLRMTDKKLLRVASFPSGGSAPCHLELDNSGRYLFISNYMSGSLAVYALDSDGMPIRMTDLKQHHGHGTNPQRQEYAHVHSAWWHGGDVYVCDLGLDTVFCYRLDTETGKLIETERNIAAPKGSGPRHCCHRIEQPEILYVDCELSGEILVWNMQQQKLLQCVSALPDGETSGWLSAIKAKGDRLYVANRGFDAFTCFVIKENGLLEKSCISEHVFKVCREFLPEETCLISADQESCQLSILCYGENGSLAPIQTCLLYPAKPTCILPL